MKKTVITFLLLLFSICVWAQSTSSQSVPGTYSFGQHIVENLDHTPFQSVKCDWSIFYIFLELNRKGKITTIHFSDSTPLLMQNEVHRIANKNEYNWPKEIVRKRSGKRVIVQPIFNQLLNDCQLPMYEPTKYRGTDSSLENELAISYYVNKVVTNQLVQVSESYRRAMLLLGNEIDYQDCILLPACIIKDKKRKILNYKTAVVSPMRKFALLCTSILLMFFLIGCFAKKEALVFEHLAMFDSYDTSISNGKVLRVKSKSFLVQGYRSNKKNDLLIDSFARGVKAQDIDSLAQFTVTFYKKSKETNAENLTKYPRVLDRHSNTRDLIFIYMWFDGKFGSRHKYKNGKIVEPENKIEISDIPDSK